ncbi:MBL fold metallo-hydrolase [Kordiimonas aestuarii]|uniref:MBL fold metallo-hydrolase n=1 Tax=Kordiimonas aestuarii TaxID=1005925 RepID=UPI0021CED768|nr:MBL fold metallo-hydrolase [Kordiimonas aestuarii]
MDSTERQKAASDLDGSDVADHRAEKRKAAEARELERANKEGLAFPLNTKPEGDKTVEVAEGIHWARIPLPWSLDHINVYLFDEGDSWTLVDTGSNGNRGKAAWEALEQGLLDGRPVSRIVATHMHPDHLGLAGWLAERHGAAFYITQAEYLLASTLWLGGTEAVPEHEVKFLFSNGVDQSYEPAIRGARFDNYRRGVSALPATYHRIEDGSLITMGGRRWRVVVGRGHSPEHACLSCLDEPLFIGGDQILPSITSNVSVHAREPMGNPLAHWIVSLDRMRAVPGNPLVLPSHGRVFIGLQQRLDALIGGHIEKLEALHKWCTECRTPVQTFPALFRRKITGMDFYLALGEAIAHLHLLEALGLMTREPREGVNHFTATGEFDTDTLLASTTKLPGISMRSLTEVY